MLYRASSRGRRFDPRKIVPLLLALAILIVGIAQAAFARLPGDPPPPAGVPTPAAQPAELAGGSDEVIRQALAQIGGNPGPDGTAATVGGEAALGLPGGTAGGPQRQTQPTKRNAARTPSAALDPDAAFAKAIEQLERERMRPTTVFRVNLRPELRDANGVVIDRGITMNDVAEIAPILAELGVDTIYVSPLYAGINPDAAHGYHPKNMNELNETLGGMAGYEAAVAGASRLGLKLLIDTVPNHMGFDPSNVWLAETLEFGRNSPMARLFEVDWNLPGLEDRMLVPKLGAPFEQVVAEGGIRFRLGAGDRPGIVQDAGGVWPVAPATYDEILADARDRLTGADRRKVVNLLKAIERLKEKPRTEAERADHVTQGRAVARTLDELVAKSPEIKHAVEQALERVNGSPERVRDLSERQHYRLDDWHLRLSDNGYLLFFDVEELIALRQQDPEVRRITHQGQWRWLDIARNHNVPAGLRIDHPDGLKKPGQYIEYIQREFFLRRVKEIAELDPDESYPAFEARVLELRDALIAADPDTIARDPLYVVVEKILTDGEPLPEGWKAHVNGTVGYEAMAAITKVLVHPAAADAMAEIYERFTGDTRAYADVVFQSKLDVMEGMALRNGTRVSPRLEYNLKRVTRRLVPVAAADGKTFTERQLREGIAAIVAAYPDYRPYTVDDNGVRLDRRGRQQIVKAAAEAKRRLPDRAPVIDYVAEVLRREGMSALVEDFADVFGQLTAPAAGVGEENTAFFRIFRDLYEVGGEPGRRMTPRQFHAFNRLRQLAGLLGLTELSTHDSKWSVAARARIMALAADPAAYETAINRMAEIAKDYPELQDNGEIAPDRSEMYRMFMLLIATLPFEEITSGKASPQYDELIRFQVKKALNEAKVNTDWINANEEWTTAVLAYLDKVLADDRFRAELRQFIQREVVVPAVATSLANRVLQMLMPGVPDIYQGDVLGQAASGLDPMNRATPDFSELQYRLRNPDGNGEDWLDYWMSGKADTAVMQRLASARKADPALYLDGEYLGVGDVSDDAPYIACARVHEGPGGPSCVIGFTPRIGAPGTPAFPLGEEWGDLTVPMPEKLPAGTYENLLDPDAPHLTITPGQELRVADLTKRLPVFALRRVPGPAEQSRTVGASAQPDSPVAAGEPAEGEPPASQFTVTADEVVKGRPASPPPGEPIDADAVVFDPDPSKYPLGATVMEDGRTLFRVLGDNVIDGRIDLVIERGAGTGDRRVRLAQHRADGHTYYWTVVDDAVGKRYGYEFRSKLIPDAGNLGLPEGQVVPDPFGVPSEPFNPLARSVVEDRRGLKGAAWAASEGYTPLTHERLVQGGILEVHVPTESGRGVAGPGTFEGLIGQLPLVREAGYAAIEVMPSTPGIEGWNYDGTKLVSVEPGTGGIEGLRQLVKAAHELGIAVIVDVQANHYGPYGNFGPAYGQVSGKGTEWGEAPDYRLEHNRRAYLEFLRLMAEVGVDGIRMDAIDRMDDDNNPDHPHIVIEGARMLHKMREDGEIPNEVMLFAEADPFEWAREDRFWVMLPLEEGGAGFKAAWTNGPVPNGTFQLLGIDKLFEEIDQLDVSGERKQQIREGVMAFYGLPRTLAGNPSDAATMKARLRSAFPEEFGLRNCQAIVGCNHDIRGNTRRGFSNAGMLAVQRLTGDAHKLRPVEAERVVMALGEIEDWNVAELASVLEQGPTPAALKARIVRDATGALTPAATEELGGWLAAARGAARQAAAEQALRFTQPFIPLSFRETDPFSQWGFYHGIPAGEGLDEKTLTGRADEFGWRKFLEAIGTPEGRMHLPQDPALRERFKARGLNADKGGFEQMKDQLLLRRLDKGVLSEDRTVVRFGPGGNGWVIVAGTGDDRRVIVYNGSEQELRGGLPAGVGDKWSSRWSTRFNSDAEAYGGAGREARREGNWVSVPGHTTVVFAPGELGLPNLSDPSRDRSVPFPGDPLNPTATPDGGLGAEATTVAALDEGSALPPVAGAVEARTGGDRDRNPYPVAEDPIAGTVPVVQFDRRSGRYAAFDPGTGRQIGGSASRRDVEGEAPAAVRRVDAPDGPSDSSAAVTTRPAAPGPSAPTAIAGPAARPRPSQVVAAPAPQAPAPLPRTGDADLDALIGEVNARPVTPPAPDTSGAQEPIVVPEQNSSEDAGLLLARCLTNCDVDTIDLVKRYLAAPVPPPVRRAPQREEPNPVPDAVAAATALNALGTRREEAPAVLPPAAQLDPPDPEGGAKPTTIRVPARPTRPLPEQAVPPRANPVPVAQVPVAQVPVTQVPVAQEGAEGEQVTQQVVPEAPAQLAPANQAPVTIFQPAPSVGGPAPILTAPAGQEQQDQRSWFPWEQEQSVQPGDAAPPAIEQLEARDFFGGLVQREEGEGQTVLPGMSGGVQLAPMTKSLFTGQETVDEPVAGPDDGAPRLFP